MVQCGGNLSGRPSLSQSLVLRERGRAGGRSEAAETASVLLFLSVWVSKRVCGLHTILVPAVLVLVVLVSVVEVEKTHANPP